MKYTKKITFIFLLTFISSISYGQQVCGERLELVICDMTSYDIDNTDGRNIPDGIIDLYDQYVAQYPTKMHVSNGTWESVNGDFGEALQRNGQLRLWNLPRATTADTPENEKYLFILENADCTSGNALIIELILGPYSGETLSSGTVDGANAEICDSEGINLIEALYTNEAAGVPAAHTNGEWTYDGSKDYVILSNNGRVTFEIPNGPASIDQETFKFTYTVAGVIPCDPVQTSSVLISVIRRPDAGNKLGIRRVFQFCEEDLKAGVHDADINLRDDIYLEGEDVGGDWSFEDDFTGQISTPSDAIVNLRELYDNMITRDGLRFGCNSFVFTYTVKDRSTKCADDFSRIEFIFYEEIRPFSQTESIPEICSTDTASIDLIDLITFTMEGGALFFYGDNRYTNWRYVSGPSSLGVIGLDDTNPDLDISYSSSGTVSVFRQPPGTYTFEYGVQPGLNCVNDVALICDPFDPNYDPSNPNFTPCDPELTQVSFTILPFDYAGENTSVAICSSETDLDLLTSLSTNGSEIVTTGIWTNDMGDVIDIRFVIPTIDEVQDFEFTYTTVSASGCVDKAILSLRVYEELSPVVGLEGEVCREDGTFDLFSLLEEADEGKGFWIGPIGYNSKVDNSDVQYLGRLDLTQNWQSGVYTYTFPVRTNGACPSPDKTDFVQVDLTIIEAITVNFNAKNRVFCKEEGQVNLFDFLDETISKLGGDFTTKEANEKLDNGNFVFEELPTGSYSFTYTATNSKCSPVSSDIDIRIIDIDEPRTAGPLEFCILDAATLASVEVVEDAKGNNVIDNAIWYKYKELDRTETLPSDTVLIDGQKVYVSIEGESDCESDRVEFTFRILNLGEKKCKLELQDGVAPNQLGDDATFNISNWGDEGLNIATVFENFELLIYNRYGSLVYNGNKNTAEFRGVGNEGIQFGKDLPSGVYFYILNPNQNDNNPIQGNFYLSK